MDIKFNSSDGPSVGIEIECQLVDEADLSLVGKSEEIISGVFEGVTLSGGEFSIEELQSSLKHELLTSCVEINTKKSNTIAEAGEDLRKKFSIVIKEARKNNTRIALAGTHPFSKWKDQEVTRNPRYKRLLDELQMVATRFNIFGLHVHVGVKSGEGCIYVLNRLLQYMPHFLALSSNSPFWNDRDSGLKSYRTKVFETLPIAGLPFYFESWADFARLVKNYLQTKTIETTRELWWDLRPHPDFGTIEVRICDAPSTINEILAIASLVQALVVKFEKEFEAGIRFERPHSFIVRENKWRAARYGLEGEFINEKGEENVPVKKIIGELLEDLAPVATSLETSSYLDKIKDILVSSSGASRQRSIFNETSEKKEIVRKLADILEAEVNAVEGDG
ncbi:MAG: YbdK family carboxylate-amine ligase [Deltaproteobacteria bacterium]|nr:YbdK family carboxylate-amine ligase [Deltaproteobacteria bacterium]